MRTCFRVDPDVWTDAVLMTHLWFKPSEFLSSVIFPLPLLFYGVKGCFSTCSPIEIRFVTWKSQVWTSGQNQENHFHLDERRLDALLAQICMSKAAGAKYWSLLSTAIQQSINQHSTAVPWLFSLLGTSGCKLKTCLLRDENLTSAGHVHRFQSHPSRPHCAARFEFPQANVNTSTCLSALSCCNVIVNFIHKQLTRLSN